MGRGCLKSTRARLGVGGATTTTAGGVWAVDRAGARTRRCARDGWHGRGGGGGGGGGGRGGGRRRRHGGAARPRRAGAGGDRGGRTSVCIDVVRCVSKGGGWGPGGWARLRARSAPPEGPAAKVTGSLPSGRSWSEGCPAAGRSTPDAAPASGVASRGSRGGTTSTREAGAGAGGACREGMHGGSRGQRRLGGTACRPAVPTGGGGPATSSATAVRSQVSRRSFLGFFFVGASPGGLCGPSLPAAACKHGRPGVARETKR
ncbi:hypothetical protein BU14_0032s0039 [Porphyra umbilicalis]|uniref:Uncharacterized protein n=1 Tax=Porphyra umbilicalis TaxID=2786 RepID=A0A1X6PIU8_PORUM|nr:hypothetical protein BU14_0032s0039 [Porphyra umbilicalis]|eukprot:OSX80782.1 hypothetical protein BU14_0032s0039 [Porphyra umbilicalis]